MVGAVGRGVKGRARSKDPLQPGAHCGHKCWHIDTPPGRCCTAMRAKADAQKQPVHRPDPQEIPLVVIAMLQRQIVQAFRIQRIDTAVGDGRCHRNRVLDCRRMRRAERGQLGIAEHVSRHRVGVAPSQRGVVQEHRPRRHRKATRAGGIPDPVERGATRRPDGLYPREPAGIEIEQRRAILLEFQPDAGVVRQQIAAIMVQRSQRDATHPRCGNAPERDVHPLVQHVGRKGEYG